MFNEKKTEVSHIRLSDHLLQEVRQYLSWRKEYHPRLTQQAAMAEALYVGLMSLRALRESICTQAGYEQEKTRSENADFATKFLGPREPVASQY